MAFESDNQLVKNFFESLLAQYGSSTKALAYGSKESQRIRFEILTQIADLHSRSVLDVGCGFADLYDFLMVKGIKVRYTGCDISPKMAAIAKQNHPDLDIRTMDILEWGTRERFDYVVGTGFNCVPTGNNEAMIRAMIQKMYELCSHGVSVGMVSDYQKEKTKNTYYANPEKLFAVCMGLCGRVTLRHDYLPHDFTIYLYKNSIPGNAALGIGSRFIQV